MVSFTNDCEIEPLIGEVTITVSDPFTSEIALVDPEGVTEVNAGTDVTLNAVTEPNPVPGATYEWISNGETVANGVNAVVQPLTDPSTSYTLIVTNADGCVEESTFSINVLPANWEIPNAFTPDNDGINDVFKVLIAGNIDMERMFIYNRWGEKVFESTDPDIGWDGKNNAKSLPSDVYVYILELRFPDGSVEVLKGDVTLLR